MAEARAECPKQMIHGPCGGVAPTGGCEVGDRPCPFHDAPVLVIEERPSLPRAVPLGQVIVDLRLPADDAELGAVVEILGSAAATALIGEHLDDPPGSDPVNAAHRLCDLGLPAIVTATGRDRSPGEHGALLEALVAAGVLAVHCVTGDHPAVRLGPDHDASFSLDGTQLAMRARAAGALVSVGESPAAPPVGARPDRVVMKETAGADLVILNHAGSPQRLIDFADRCADVGATVDLVAPVPVITDHASARALQRFPGLVLPPGLVDRVLGASDPVVAGVAAAAEMASDLLSSGRFRGVNLSGAAGGSGPIERARIMRRVATTLG